MLPQVTFANNEQIPLRKSDSWTSVLQGSQMLSAFLTNATNAYVQGMGPQSQQYGNYRMQFEQTWGLRPEDPRAVPPVFSGCIVLPARGNQVGSGSMCSQISDQEILGGYAAAMIDVAESNLNKLENFTTPTHDRTEIRGVGCYEERMKDFNTRLLAREEELSKYRNNIKKMVDNFELTARNDLEAIKQNSAILDGPRNKEEADRYLRDYRFENVLLGSTDNGICGSVFSAESLARTGQKDGLRGIERNVFAKVEPAQSFQAKSKQIIKEIKTFSKELSSRVKQRRNLNFSDPSFINQVNTNNRIMTPNSAALKAAVQRAGTKIENQVNDLIVDSDIEQIVGGDETAASIFSGVRSGALRGDNMANRLLNFERRTQTKCVNDLISSNFGSADKLLNRFRNPNVSNRMNKDADNALANNILAYLQADTALDLDDLIKQIKREESQGLNARKVMTTGKTFNFDGKTVNASTPLRPSQLFGIFVSNCKQRYNSLQDALGFSAADKVNAIRSFASKRNRIARTAAGTIARDVQNELLNCPADTSTGVAANTCSDATLNTSSQDFCVATARKCSANAVACHQKTTAALKKIEGQQKVFVDNYRNEVNALKQNMLAELQGIESFMEGQARSLDAQLNIGTVFEVPKLGIDLANEKAFARTDVRSELLLEDPQKYLKAVDTQLDELEKKLKEQRIAMLGPNGNAGRIGEIASQYARNYDQAKNDYSKLMNDCNKAYQRAMTNRQKQQEEIARTNGEINQACAALRAFNENPMSGDPQDLADQLSNAVQIAAAAPQAAGNPMSASDQQMISQIRAVSCSGDRDGRDLGSLANRVPISDICADEDMRASYGRTAARDCALAGYPVEGSTRGLAGALQPCQDESQFADNLYEALTSGNRKLCESDNDAGYVAKTKCEQTINGTTVELTEISKSDFVARLKSSDYQNSSNISDAGCFVRGYETRQIVRDQEDALENLEEFAQVYGCVHERNQLRGRLGVSVCNAGANGYMNDKGIWGQMTQQLGTAFGQAMALGD